MRKNLLKTSVLIASMALVLGSCNKNDGDDPPSGNATNGKTTAVFNSSVTYGTMTDQVGNVYKTVTKGTQTWMAENLRTTKYNDGTAIPNVTDFGDWWRLTTGAFCNYNNAASNVLTATYGRLYNWYAVNTDRLCPTGWHVPTDAEWTTLSTYLGGESVAGDKLKETGNTHWTHLNTGATNETGFTALPGGYRDDNATFSGTGLSGFWWSTTEFDADYAWYRVMFYENSDVVRPNFDKVLGLSVRCVRD